METAALTSTKAVLAEVECGNEVTYGLTFTEATRKALEEDCVIRRAGWPLINGFIANIEFGPYLIQHRTTPEKIFYPYCVDILATDWEALTRAEFSIQYAALSD